MLPAGMFGAIASLCLVGMLSAWSVLSPRLDAQRYQKIGDAVGDWHYFSAGLRQTTTPSGLRIETAGAGTDKVLFFGDSNMQQYVPRIERILGQSFEHPSAVFATSGGCLPIVGAPHPSRPDCAIFVERAVQLAADPSFKSVVIAAAWMSYFNPEMLSQSEANFASVGETIRELTENGKTAWLVLNIPTGADLAPANAVQRDVWGGAMAVPLELPRAQFDRSWGPVKAKLVEVARSAGARIIDPSEWMCSETACRGETDDGSPIYTDGGHLRASYARDHAIFIDQTLDIVTGSITK
jgi:hypothetical protein